MSIELRVFRRLVRLMFPEEFRGGYEAEMARTYRAQRREAAEHGPLSVLRLWIRDAGRPGADRAPAAPGVPATGPPRRRPADGGAARLRVRGGPGARPRHRLDNGRLQPRRCRAPASRAVRRAGPARRDPRTDAPGRGAVGAVLHGVPGSPSRCPFVRAGRRLHAERRAPRRTRPASTGRSSSRRTSSRRFGCVRWPAAVSIRMKTCQTARPWCSSATRSPASASTAKQAIGRSIPVDGRASTVVGVLPSELRFPDRDVELWLPMSARE